MIPDKVPPPRDPRFRGMRGLRRHRGWLSAWLVVVLLWTQLATAVHACPRLAPAAEAGVAGVALVPRPDGGDELPASVDPGQPSLCQAHCEAGKSSLSRPEVAPDAPQVMAVGAALVGVVDVADAAQVAALMPASTVEGPPAGARPLYLAFLVLRN